MKKLPVQNHNTELEEDKAYWRGLKNDDSDALKELFTKYYDQLYFYGLKLLGKHDLVVDTIQDIFTALWENRHKLAEVQYIKAYLFASLRNNILKPRPSNVLNNSEPSTVLNQGFHFDLSPEDIYLEEETNTENRRIIENLLKHLSPKQKEIIYLKFYNNYSNSEIGEILSIKHQSVANLLQRTINKLRNRKKLDNLYVVNMLITGLI
ncbi:MAG: hypothetical protein B7C24_02695 [Bacteroidetes bacterium 4572_77]|nr:MAG: hypothetical protein B7C24_02695 [Bacteroidetes bacterium 4572_77]